MAKKQKTRLEYDFLGEKEIPDSIYYGVQTLRALENFKIPDIPISLAPRFVQALGYLKKTAAPANMDLWELPQEITRAIIVACDAVISGELNDQFIVGAIQGGAGTATNMNANEVIVNKALETVQSVRDIVLDKGLVDKVILEESTTFYPDGGERENIHL